MATLAEIEARVLARAQLRSTDTLITQSVRYTAINEAIGQVSLEQDWPWLSATVAVVTVPGTASYALPADFLRTLQVMDLALGNNLLRSNPIDVLGVIYRGRPSQYAYDANNLLVAPIPSEALTLTHYYLRIEPELTDPGDEPLMPDYAIRGVVEFASADLLRQRNIQDRAADCAAAYKAWLSRLIDNNDSSVEPIIPRVRPGSQF